MNPVTILRHIECEGPGYLEKTLKKYKIPTQLIAIDLGNPVPQDIKNTSGLIIMGGPMSANDNDEWIKNEILLIRKAIDQNLPVLGHCLGGQFIARALGAKITQNPIKEIGWLPVFAAEKADNPGWVKQFKTPQMVFHWHGETFELPEGAELLLSSKDCTNQAFRYKENVYAFQCHIEMTRDMIDEWSTLYADEISAPSDTIQPKSSMMQSTEKHITKLNQLADCVYEDWVQYLK